jgi:hypothetical protein
MTMTHVPQVGHAVAGAVLLIGSVVCLAQATESGGAGSPELRLRDAVSQYGITWTFAESAPVGRFVTGDYYVVGPVTVASVAPAPADGHNGSMLNPPTTSATAYDSGIRSYDESLGARFPLRMEPGDSLVSTISYPSGGRHKHVYPHFEESSGPLKTAAVLTCLAEAVPADTFRPSYCGPKDKLYRLSDLRTELLPSVARVEDTPSLALYERIFQRPWIDHTYTWVGRATHPTENMPDYGREIARAVSDASLLLMLDFSPQEKEKLLIGLVQYGLDLWGVVQEGGGWRANGGHASGRKWPIVFAGLLFQDEAMQKPKAEFGEDMQTYYGEGHYGSKALWRIVRRSGLQPEHEHLPPSEWPKMQPEGYRRCCTALAWVGTALSGRMMHAEAAWDHQAFFDYVDRWMTEDDTQELADIEKHWGTAPSIRQGETWSKFVDQMWAKYRNDLPPAPGR